MHQSNHLACGTFKTIRTPKIRSQIAAQPGRKAALKARQRRSNLGAQSLQQPGDVPWGQGSGGASGQQFNPALSRAMPIAVILWW